jgi:hypothetical protein
MFALVAIVVVAGLMLCWRRDLPKFPDIEHVPVVLAQFQSRPRHAAAA